MCAAVLKSWPLECAEGPAEAAGEGAAVVEGESAEGAGPVQPTPGAARHRGQPPARSDPAAAAGPRGLLQPEPGAAGARAGGQAGSGQTCAWPDLGRRERPTVCPVEHI